MRKNTCDRDGRCSPPEFRPAGSSATRSMPNALKKPPDELGCPGGGSAIWTLLQRWRSEGPSRCCKQSRLGGAMFANFYLGRRRGTCSCWPPQQDRTRRKF